MVIPDSLSGFRDQEFKGSVTLDNGNAETPKPDKSLPMWKLFGVWCKGRDRVREDLWNGSDSSRGFPQGI
jgi:hypothetical protein